MRRYFQKWILVKSLNCGPASGAKSGWSKAISPSITSRSTAASSTSRGATPARAASVSARPGAGDDVEHGPAACARTPASRRDVLGVGLGRQDDQRQRIDPGSNASAAVGGVGRTCDAPPGRVREDALEVVEQAGGIVGASVPT